MKQLHGLRSMIKDENCFTFEALYFLKSFYLAIFGKEIYHRKSFHWRWGMYIYSTKIPLCSNCFNVIYKWRKVSMHILSWPILATTWNVVEWVLAHELLLVRDANSRSQEQSCVWKSLRVITTKTPARFLHSSRHIYFSISCRSLAWA